MLLLALQAFWICFSSNLAQPLHFLKPLKGQSLTLQFLSRSLAAEEQQGSAVCTSPPRLYSRCPCPLCSGLSCRAACVSQEGRKGAWHPHW